MKQLIQGCCEISGGTGIQILVSVFKVWASFHYYPIVFKSFVLKTNVFLNVFKENYHIIAQYRKKIKVEAFWFIQWPTNKINLFPSRRLDGIA